MDFIKDLEEKVYNHHLISKEEALELYRQPCAPLCEAADRIRRHFCGDAFDLCTIINGKSGSCSENCKFCAQSAHNACAVQSYPLLPAEKILAEAKANGEKGVLRFSIVTSGKRLSDAEVEEMCHTIRKISAETDISLCVSFGLLNETQYRKLKEAGVTRVHNNLESSEQFFPHICTTHSFQDKISAIRAAQSAGLTVCSGGIMGLGETPEDRIDMALTLRELKIRSVPVNLLNPIPGTPFEKNPPLSPEEFKRILAVYRFILPDAFIRLAGGRGLLPDKGEECFRSGANAAISGDMLTTAGITVKTDLALLSKMGYQVKKAQP